MVSPQVLFELFQKSTHVLFLTKEQSESSFLYSLNPLLFKREMIACHPVLSKTVMVVHGPKPKDPISTMQPSRFSFFCPLMFFTSPFLFASFPFLITTSPFLFTSFPFLITTSPFLFTIFLLEVELRVQIFRHKPSFIFEPMLR